MDQTAARAEYLRTRIDRSMVDYADRAHQFASRWTLDSYDDILTRARIYRTLVKPTLSGPPKKLRAPKRATSFRIVATPVDDQGNVRLNIFFLRGDRTVRSEFGFGIPSESENVSVVNSFSWSHRYLAIETEMTYGIPEVRMFEIGADTRVPYPFRGPKHSAGTAAA